MWKVEDPGDFTVACAILTLATIGDRQPSVEQVVNTFCEVCTEVHSRIEQAKERE